MMSSPIDQSEQIVCGAAMLHPDVVPGLADRLSPTDFEKPAHATIWQAIVDVHAAGAPTDAVSIAHGLNASGELARVGGAGYLHTLIAAVPNVANAGYHADQVAEAARRRRLAEIGARLTQAAGNPSADLQRVLESSRDALEARDDTEWPEPVPLTTTRAVPSFPTGMLPEWLGDMVTATATATQTPSDMAGSLALACLSAATMGRVIVAADDGWTEQTSLFTCVALAPGNRKSSVFATMTKPLREAEAALADEARPKVIEARTEKAIAIRAAEAALAAAGKNATDLDAVNNAKTTAREAEEIIVPAEPHLIADDITPEATKTLLAEQGGRLAVMSAEGGIFATIAGRYSGVPDLDVFLKGHAGDMLRVTRKSSPVEEVDRPALTMGLAVQPSVLRDIAAIPGFEDRGLLARFLFALPASTVGTRNPSPPAIPPAVRQAYHRRLREMACTLWHATNTTLELTADARRRVVALETEREPKLGPGGEWEPVINWANKWTGAVLRIAGLLHIADNLATGWRHPINADTIDAAAHIGHYYAHHALAVWEHMGTNQTGPAHLVLNWLIQQRQPKWTRRELHRALHRRLALADLDDALRVLADHGHVRAHQPPRNGRGRKPSPVYFVHPQYVQEVNA